MKKYNKISCKMCKHLVQQIVQEIVQQKVQQKAHNDYPALLIKQIVFTKSLECLH